MTRTNKLSKSAVTTQSNVAASVTSPPVVAASVTSPPVVAASVTSQPVVEKTVKAVKSKKTNPVKEVVAPLSTDTHVQVSNQLMDDDVHVDDVPVGHEQALDEDVTLTTEKSIAFLAKLQQLGTLISSLKVEYRALEKQSSRELKAAQKQNSKRKRKAGNRAPSGFVKPTRISDELATFLDKPSGTEMARTEVTREINVYIRKHNLQDSNNGRKINPDTNLSSLLKLNKTDDLTYFNLQKYMSPHFAKATKVETTNLEVTA